MTELQTNVLAGSLFLNSLLVAILVNVIARHRAFRRVVRQIIADHRGTTQALRGKLAEAMRNDRRDPKTGRYVKAEDAPPEEKKPLRGSWDY